MVKSITTEILLKILTLINYFFIIIFYKPHQFCSKHAERIVLKTSVVTSSWKPK